MNETGTAPNQDLAGSQQSQAFLSPKIVGIAVFVFAMVFAFFTNHAWEDFYITYRTSVNLATGKGFVFTPGQHIHAYTSVLNTIVPAFFRFIVGEGKDQLVLWLYRIVSAGSLAVACSIVYAQLRQMKFGNLTLLATMVIFGLEAKLIDYTINGQEVAFMVLFLSLSAMVLVGNIKRPALVLGLAWAGAMYTRPDAFIYCAAIAISVFIFPAASSRKRIELLKIFAIATGCVVILYLPWALWAWSYYGSPVPHTITAKGLGLPTGLRGQLERHLYIMRNVQTIPLSQACKSVYMPAVFFYGGWPKQLTWAFAGLAYIASFYWLIPFANPKARAFSFATLICLYYLNYVPTVAASWYYPNAGVFTSLAIGFILFDLKRSTDWIISHNPEQSLIRTLKLIRTAIPAIIILAILAVTCMVAIQIRIQQRLIEDGVRTKIGLWLKDNAKSPNDTVFLECLGYIGYFSNLKMYDFPGLCSPEVVEARKRVGNDWGNLIQDLKPDWLVLRVKEIGGLNSNHPGLLESQYTVAKRIDVLKEVEAQPFIPGRDYLYFDIGFTIFKRKANE